MSLAGQEHLLAAIFHHLTDVSFTGAHGIGPGDLRSLSAIGSGSINVINSKVYCPVNYLN